MSVWSSLCNKFKVRIFVVYLFINKNVCVKQDLEVSLFLFHKLHRKIPVPESFYS